MSRLLLSLLVVCSVALAACARPTQVVIVVTADSYVTTMGVRRLLFDVEGSDGRGGPRMLTDSTTVTAESLGEPIRFPFRFVVEPLGGDALRTYAVTLRATLQNNRIVRAQRVSSYVSGEVRQIYIHLEEICADVTSCETFGFTCSGGECVSAMVNPMVIPPEGTDANVDAALDRLDGAVMTDAAMDAGVIADARSDTFMASDAGVDAWSEFDTNVDAALAPDDAGMDAGMDARFGVDAFTLFDAEFDAAPEMDDAWDAGDPDSPVDAHEDDAWDAGDPDSPVDAPEDDAWDAGDPDSPLEEADAPDASTVGLVINEVDYEGGSFDFVEIYNNSDTDVNLALYTLAIYSADCETSHSVPMRGPLSAHSWISIREDIASSSTLFLTGPAGVEDSVSFNATPCGSAVAAGVVDLGPSSSAQLDSDAATPWILDVPSPGVSNGP